MENDQENFLVDLGPNGKPPRFFCMTTQSSYLCINPSLFFRLLPSHFYFQFTELGRLKMQIVMLVILKT